MQVQKVRIQYGEQGIMSIAEVSVLDWKGSNLALNKLATQSSVDSDFEALKAVNGDFDDKTQTYEEEGEYHLFDVSVS